MKEFIHPRLSLLSALALACAPLHAEATNDTAAAPAAVAEQSAQAYAPAMLPQETEGVLFIPHLSQSIEALEANLSPSKAHGKKAKCHKGLSSIDNLIVSEGKGSAKTLGQLLTLHTQLLSKQSLHMAKDLWLLGAKPEYHAAIAGSFDAEIQASTAKLKETAQNLHIAPVYIALTATPGKEAEFDKLCSMLTPNIERKSHNRVPNAQAAEWQGFTGIQVPLKDLMPHRRSAELAQLEPELSRMLEEKTLFILSKKQDNTIIFICCSDTADISLPSAPTSTLAQSPALLAATQAGSALHFWLSPELQQAYFENNEENSLLDLIHILQVSSPQSCKRPDNVIFSPALPALKAAFEKIAEADAANAPAFHTAAAGIKRMQDFLFSNISISKEFSLSVKQEEDNIHIAATSDAMGIHYENGVLHAASMAEEQGTLLYAEGTKATCADTINADGLVETTLHIAKGFTLTLEEGMQDAISPYLQQVEFFLPDVNALFAAFKTTCSGLTAPHALVITAEQKGGKPQIAGALSSAVENRAALADGWAAIKRVIGSVAAKLGLPADIPLPIMEQPISDSATAYKLALPLMFENIQAQVCVSDKSFVMGIDSNLNTKLLNLNHTEGTPFRGFTARINIEPCMKAMLGCGVFGSSAHTIINSKIHSISGSMVDEDGVLIQNWRIHLQKDAPAGE